MIAPLLFGVLGAAVLVSLGVWQMQRLAWKQGVLAEIEARIMAEPVPLPAKPEPGKHRFLPVRVEGVWQDNGLRVLSSLKQVGAGHRLIGVIEADGRRLMVDRGFLRQGETAAKPEGPATVVGNLHWPDEKDSFTPQPDLDAGLWFARDVPAMARALDAEPVLIVAREITPGDPALILLPLDTAGIPNNHLQYAITWFSLAVVWLGMTALLVWRIRQQTV